MLINQLPNEVLAIIFKLLNKYDLISIQKVCVLWNCLLKYTNEIWIHLYKQESYHKKFLKIYRENQFQICYKQLSIAKDNFKSGEFQQTILVGHSENITSIQFNGTLNQILSSSFDKTIKIWDYNNLENVKTINFNSTIMDIQLDNSNKNIICGSVRGQIHFLNLETFEIKSIDSAHSGYISTLQGNNNSRLFCSASGKDKFIKLWDMSDPDNYNNNNNNNKLIKTFENDKPGVNNVIWCNINDNLIYSSSGSIITQWDIESGKAIRKFTSLSIINPDCLSVQDNLIASGGESKQISIFDSRDNDSTSPSITINHSSSVYALQYEPRLNRLVTGHGQDHNYVCLWDPSSRGDSNGGNLLKSHTSHTSSVNILHMDQDKIISGSLDSNLCVWDYNSNSLNSSNSNNGESLYKLKGHTSMIRCGYFDDTKIISGSLDNSVILWDFSSNYTPPNYYNNNKCNIM